ncbi:MAG: four helix bundle protein [Ruminococcus sp.]
MVSENIVLQKSKRFAIRIIRLTRFLQEEKREFVISKQIVRSGTSIGANITEAEYGFSKKDFLSKMYIALKECAETLYWLELLYMSEYITKNQYISMNQDCEELRKILSSITKTTRNDLE